MGILKIVLVLAVLTLVRWLLSRPATTPSGTAQRRRSPRPPSGKMVKDPHCGTHVAQELAVQAQSDGHTLMFCSERCRDEYLHLRQPSGQSG